MKPTWKKYRLYGSIIIVGMTLILAGYRVVWTGFGDYVPPNSDYVRAKTLWDWLELFIVPLFLAGGAFYLNRSEREAELRRTEEQAKLQRQRAEEQSILERQIATDRQQESALQAYLDRISDLLLDKDLQNEKVRNVARIRTLTVLRVLDARRSGLIMQFLHEANLINKKNAVVDLKDSDFSGLDLSNVNFYQADLRRADFSHANLSGADLSDANLHGAFLNDAILTFTFFNNANLSNAILSRANMHHAILTGANLKQASLNESDLRNGALSTAKLTDASLNGANLANADLMEATVSAEQLATAKSLKGATMPDGTTHD
jgi:uncharacterized protein YjbI with pentapeptide repeats